MDELTNLKPIKELPIMNNDKRYFVEEYIQSCFKNGVDIGELMINPYVYNHKFLDTRFCIIYFKVISAICNFFRNLFDQQIFLIRNIKDAPPLPLYDINFHEIFSYINTTLNVYVDDVYIWDDFLIYGSETSFEIFYIMYDQFNEILMERITEKVSDKLFISRMQLYKMNVQYNHLATLYDEMNK